MNTEIITQIQSLVDSTQSVEELCKLRDTLRAPFNVKIRAIEKAQREAKRALREAEAEKLCLALVPGEKLLMQEHGFLDIFSGVPGSGDVFFDKNVTVHVYQPRKRILWLNVTGTRGMKREKFKQCRPFRLHEVASHGVRRPS
jgi:hypothetical protein